MKNLMTRRALPLLLATLSMGAIATPQTGVQRGPRPLAAEVWAKTELYFGTGKPDGTFVSNEEFRGFVDRQVTPRFPDGLTVVTGYGQFLNSAGTIEKETSKVLILFYPAQTVETNRQIQAIREAYKYEYQQESVLRADSASLVSF
jgi:hypothetical protein